MFHETVWWHAIYDSKRFRSWWRREIEGFVCLIPAQMDIMSTHSVRAI